MTRRRPPSTEVVEDAVDQRPRQGAAGRPQGIPRRRLSSSEVVGIETWARAHSLEVHEVEDVRVRTWASRGFESEHLSLREGLPAPLKPGTYGPFEAGMQLRVRVTPEAEHAVPRPSDVKRRKSLAAKHPKPRGGRR